MATIDNFTFEKATDRSVDGIDKPVLKREWIYVVDQNNSGVYSNNMVEFNTNGIKKSVRKAEPLPFQGVFI